MTIKLVDAAKYYKELPHQREAWEWLEKKISADTLGLFAEKYRTVPKPIDQFPNTWDGVVAAAKAAGSRWPECVAAQWALESGYGQHLPADGKHNYFGLKGTGTSVDTQEFINGKMVTINDKFRKYKDTH